MKKFLQFIILFMGSLAGSNSIAAYNYDFLIDGVYYNIIPGANMQVEVTRGTSDYLGRNTSYSGEVKIPSSVNYYGLRYTVTSIGKYAFSSNLGGCDVTRVSIPYTVTQIQDYAFNECKNLTTVDIPESSKLEDIGKYAFFKTPIKSFYFGPTLKNINEAAFAFCSSLQAIVFRSIPKFGIEAFFSSDPHFVFFTTEGKPNISLGTFGSLQNIFVPSPSEAGIGKAYTLYGTNQFTYNGKNQKLKWASPLMESGFTCTMENEYTKINAGTYTWSPVLKIKSTKYNLEEFSVKLPPISYTINKAPLSISINNTSRFYGEDNPEFEIETIGLVNGETIESVGLEISCDATKESNAGIYPFKATIESPNYNFSFNENFTIYPVNLLVSAENAERMIREDNPEFRINYDGFVNNENEDVLIQKPVAYTNASKYSPAGIYTIYVEGGVAENYTFEYKTGVLTIVDGNNGVDSIEDDCLQIKVMNHSIYISYKPQNALCELYDLQGKLLYKTYDSEIKDLKEGIYILKIRNKTNKIVVN